MFFFSKIRSLTYDCINFSSSQFIIINKKEEKMQYEKRRKKMNYEKIKIKDIITEWKTEVTFAQETYLSVRVDFPFF